MTKPNTVRINSQVNTATIQPTGARIMQTIVYTAIASTTRSNIAATNTSMMRSATCMQ